jgi:hypothetical protein
LLYYANTRCFAAGADRAVIPKNKISGKGKTIIVVIVFVLILIVAAGSIVLVAYGERDPVYTISQENNTFTIESMYGTVIDLSSINSIELHESLPGGLSRTNGYGGFGSTLKGYCRSDLGPVTVFLDTAVPPFIYLSTADTVYIFNATTSDQTKPLYYNLRSAAA